MTSIRPHPFGLVFDELAGKHFPAIVAVTGSEPTLDVFLAAEPAVQLLHDLRPDSGLGEAVDDFVVLIYSAFRFWIDGEQTRVLTEAATRDLVSAEAATSAVGRPDLVASPGESVTRYIQVAPRLIWSKLENQEHHEPLDGWFVTPHQGGLRVVACLGLHPARPGLSVLVAEGPRPESPERSGPALYSPAMPGGDTAGLYSVTTADELLLLAWRAVASS